MRHAPDAFWTACTSLGIRSKKLSIRLTQNPVSTLGLTLCEPVKYGSPVIIVPYNAVFNGQTVRGDLLPRALPPFGKTLRFLTRKHQMDSIAAQRLWLACFLACYRQQCAASQPPETLLPAPLLSDLVYPPMPALLSEANKSACPVLRDIPEEEFSAEESRIENELQLANWMLRRYAKRKGVSPPLQPSRDVLVLAHRTIMQRAVLLPWNGEPSAPEELPELIETSPDLPLLPSLVPVIDMIRAPPPSDTSTAQKEAVAVGSNCAVFTCVQSDFLSASNRRRVIIETEPLAARRVVICAAKDLKEDEELLLEFE